jgi:hypothetical protein
LLLVNNSFFILGKTSSSLKKSNDLISYKETFINVCEERRHLTALCNGILKPFVDELKNLQVTHITNNNRSIINKGNIEFNIFNHDLIFLHVSCVNGIFIN